MAERIRQLGATVLAAPSLAEIPALIARIARLWAELHEADRELALELARKLPLTHIKTMIQSLSTLMQLFAVSVLGHLNRAEGKTDKK